MFELPESPLQKAILVQIYFPEKKGSFFSVNRFLEFKDLAVSSGAKISYEDQGKQKRPTAGLFISKGRAQRIKDLVQEFDSDLDDEDDESKSN